MIYIPEISKSYDNGVFIYHNGWMNFIDSSKEYKALIKRCLEFCKPEIYFNYLYRFIIKYDFEENGIPYPSEEKLVVLFLEAASKILKEKCFLLLSENETHYSLDWGIPHKNYSQEAESFKSTILSFVNYQPDTYPIIGLNTNDNPYLNDNSAFFFQNVMLASFLIAFNRIKSEIKNEEFFGIEIIPFDNKEILNIYLTPNGMLNLKSIHSWNKDKIISYFNLFIERLGFKRIYEKPRLAEFNTSILFERAGNTYYYPKYKYYDYANDFITKRIDRPHLNSIIAESQASYRST